MAKPVGRIVPPSAEPLIGTANRRDRRAPGLPPTTAYVGLRLSQRQAIL